MDDLTPDPPALEQVEDNDKDVEFFDLDTCAESFKGYLQNMINHVTPEHRIPLIIKLNSMLQEKAKELSSGK